MGVPPDDLRHRLQRVPERHLLALRALACGFGTAELAALLGVPEGAVRPTLRLAAAKLVAVLAEADPGRPPGPASAGARQVQYPPADAPGPGRRLGAKGDR